MIKVILVEDDIEMLEGLKNVIDWEQLGFTIVGTARNGKTGISLVEKHFPDIIITDITMPVMSGLDLINEAKKINPKIKSIIISCHEEFDYAREALRLNANEYLLKHTLTAETLTKAINNVKMIIDKEASVLKDYYGIAAQDNSQSYHLNELMALYENRITEIKDTIKNSDGCMLLKLAKNFYEETSNKYHAAPTKVILSKLLIELAMIMEDSRGISVEALQLKNGKEYFMDTIQIMSEKLTMVKYKTSNTEVLKAIEYIESHLNADISGKAVAKYVNMNSSYFSRLFSKELGLSFSDFVLQKRIDKATDLLLNTKHSVDEIAEMVGIESISYFYRIYKRVTGKTPGDIRK